MATNAAFFGQVTIDTDNYGITLDGGDYTLDTGDFYLYHPTDDDSSLVKQLEECLANALGASVSVTVSTSGIVTITSDGGSFAITNWETYDIFGFTANNMSGSDSYTSTNPMQYSWFPALIGGVTNSLTPTNRQGQRRPVASQTVGLDGTPWSSKFGTFVYQELTFSFISQALTFNASDDNSSFEEFWNNVYSQGRRMLFMPDYGNSNTAWEYVADLKNMPDLAPGRNEPRTNLYWDVVLRLRGIN